MTYVIKSAEIGGTGNKQSFEKTLSDLAHRYIKDNAPTLMKGNYEQGFQLLEKSDDDTKAVGVLGFNVNQMQIYCPVFFLNGELKGNEMMYLADQDIFVPVKEAWLNKIMGRKPLVVGEGIDKETHRRGYSNPDITIFKDAPIKRSGYYPKWMDKFLPNACKILGKGLRKSASNLHQLYKKLRVDLALDNYVKNVDVNTACLFKEAMDKHPLIKQAYVAYYGNSNYLDKIYNMRDLNKNTIDVRFMDNGHAITSGQSSRGLLEDTSWIPSGMKQMNKSAAFVRIISYSATLNSPSEDFLTETDKNKLARDGFLVMDNRDDSEVSKVVSKNCRGLKNPGRSGYYNVFMKDGTLKPRLIIVPNRHKNWDKEECCGQCCHAYSPSVSVINMDSGAMYTADLNQVMCDGMPGKVPTNKLQTATESSLQDARIENTPVIFVQGDKIIGPVNICSSLGKTVKGITFEGYICGDRWSNMSIILTRKGSTLKRSSEDTLHVPEGCDCFICDSGYTGGRSASPDELGDIAWIKQSSAGITEDIKLYVNGDSCFINGKRQNGRFGGLCTLIKEKGLREKDAVALMKSAESNLIGNQTITATIKRAAELDTKLHSDIPFPYDDPTSNSGNIMGYSLPSAPSNVQMVQGPRTELAPGTGPYANTLDPSFPAQDAQRINTAIQQGQQEVFDVSMLKQLLKNVNTSDHVDKYTSKLVRAMDNVGRLLFLYYWKGDQFQELYGSQDLPELEGGLRKTFEMLGDLVLFLEKKSTKPTVYTGDNAINLAAIED